MFIAAVGLLSLFLLKRKEAYFLWSIIAPRITGSAPILEYLLQLAREEGPGNDQLNDLLELHIPFLPPLYFIFKESYVKRVIALEADNFPSGGFEGPMVRLAAGSGKNVLLSPGPPSPHWVKYREVTSVVNKDRFGNSSLVGQMFDVTWRTTQELSTSYLSGKRGQSLDLFYELYNFMMPAHNRALFGESIAKKFTYNDLSKDIYEIVTETGKLLKFDGSPPWVKGPYFARINRITETVRNMAKSSDSLFMKPFLDATRNGLLSEEELISNVMIFEYAQAPLHVAFWVLYLLALHPEEEKKVMNEISNVLAQGPLTYDRVGEFKHLSRVLAETLRLYPGVGLMQVRVSKNNTMFGSHFIPEGAYIFLCTYLIHRNANYWPNPDDFEPSREGIDSARYGEKLSYIPFGTGPRQCQGQYFAQDFVKVAVISLLQHHKITLAPGQKEAVPTEIGFLRPAFPVFVQLSERVLPPPQVPAAVPSSSAQPIVPPISEVQKVQPRVVIPANLNPMVVPAQPRSPSSSRKIPPRLSRGSKTATLISQSQIFKDSYISVGKLKNNKDVLVLYGSQSGNSRAFALRLVHMAELCKLSTTLFTLSELDVSTLSQYKNVIVVTSTYLDGGAPENAEKFNNWLEKQTSNNLLSGIPYAVLALGSSLYPFPFKFGNFVSRKFKQLGAEKLIPDERIDDIRYNQQEEFTRWSVRLLEAIGTQGRVATDARALVARNKMLGFHNFDFTMLCSPFKLSFVDKVLRKESRLKYPENFVLASVTSNELVNSEPTNLIYSIELTYKEGSLAFQAGDNAIVLPSNPVSLVDSLIERIGFAKDRVFNVEAQEMSTEVDLSCSLGKNKCTLEIALTYYYDITNPPSASMLQFLAMQSNDPEEQKTLLSYSSNYLSFSNLHFTVLDVLESLPSVRLSTSDMKKDEEALAIFLGLLGPIKPRHYSIGNFPDASSNQLRLIYKVVAYTTKEGQEKRGLCSTYLQGKKQKEDIAICVAKSKFRLPSENHVPIVLVGAGSGISPYFGFLEQRSHLKGKGEKLGKAILVHGCRSEADFALKGRVDAALLEGVLAELWPAYSRNAETPRAHVQDVVEQQGKVLWDLLNNEEGILYVCGDLTVGVAVRDSLVRIAQTHGKMGAFTANSWLRRLITVGRIRSDEWGISTSSGASVIRAARLKLWRKSILAIFAFHGVKKVK